MDTQGAMQAGQDIVRAFTGTQLDQRVLPHDGATRGLDREACHAKRRGIEGGWAADLSSQQSKLKRMCECWSWADVLVGMMSHGHAVLAGVAYLLQAHITNNCDGQGPRTVVLLEECLQLPAAHSGHVVWVACTPKPVVTIISGDATVKKPSGCNPSEQALAPKMAGEHLMVH